MDSRKNKNSAKCLRSCEQLYRECLSDGNEEVYCASADWMDRNFFRRIEIMFPILDHGLKQRLIADLDLYLVDNTQAWELGEGGEYRLPPLPADAEPICAQTRLLKQLAESA